MCKNFDISWFTTTNVVHNSWKVKIYHASLKNCGWKILHIYIIWFMIYLFLLLRLPEKRKEWIQTLFIFYPWFFYCFQRIWLFQKMPRKVCTMLPHQHIHILYTYTVLQYYITKLGIWVRLKNICPSHSTIFLVMCLQTN